MTGKLPFDDINLEAAITLRVVQGDLPAISSSGEISQVRTLCTMMKRCWEMKPDARPTARDFEKSIDLMVGPFKTGAYGPNC